MKVIVVFKCLLASGTTNMAAIYSNGGNCWNILGFNFNKRDVLSSVYKISMGLAHEKFAVLTGTCYHFVGLVVVVIVVAEVVTVVVVEVVGMVVAGVMVAGVVTVVVAMERRTSSTNLVPT